MQSYLTSAHYDLVSPDGKVKSIDVKDDGTLHFTLHIEQISPSFVGFTLDKARLMFNLKSALAQMGVESKLLDVELDFARLGAEVRIAAYSLTPIAAKLLKMIPLGAYMGKLFAADERRIVRDPEYLIRLFDRSDRHGDPLLSLGGIQEQGGISIEKIEGRAVARLPLLNQSGTYPREALEGLLPTFVKAMCNPNVRLRPLIHLHQTWKSNGANHLSSDDLLLVRTLPLHVRTVFAKVVDDMLPKGYHHTQANVLEPSTRASGDVYELYGKSREPIESIPLEFYTLEPHREHLAFSDRDKLSASLSSTEALQAAFNSAPEPESTRTATFAVKGSQFLELSSGDWITSTPSPTAWPGLDHPTRQAELVQSYIKQQPEYPFLKSIEEELITSEGVLLSRYLPTPMMKQMLIAPTIRPFIKALYFQYPSEAYGEYFSHEDRSFFFDLAKFGIPVYWLDPRTSNLLRYTPKPEKDSGMFVPLKHTQTFREGTTLGIYGSNLIEGDFEPLLRALLQGVLKLKEEIDHPLLGPKKPLVFVTGGGPGAMELGSKVAQELGILSCANVMDFRQKAQSVVNEQKQNPYIEGKMTYRMDRLVERQAEFHLDFPIFAQGGIGTDFEYTVEEVRRKVGSSRATPVLLFGNPSYWKEKVTSRFHCNRKSGTIAGSEWVSNCFYCIQTAEQGLEVYRKYLTNELAIGPDGPIFEDGFATI